MSTLTPCNFLIFCPLLLYILIFIFYPSRPHILKRIMATVYSNSKLMQILHSVLKGTGFHFASKYFREIKQKSQQCPTMPVRGHLPSLAKNPVMFPAHPTKSVASIASNTRAGKPHWNLAAVHWLIRQRGDRINSSWKLCHWATRKGSFFQEQDLPQQCCFIRNMSRAWGREKGRAAGTLHLPSFLLAGLQKGAGRRKVVLAQQGPPRADL